MGEWVNRCAGPLTAKPQSCRIGVTLLGSPDDLGVRLNGGRAGAKSGPSAIRKHLFKMTPPVDYDWERSVELFDGGDTPVSTDILKTHADAKSRARQFAQRSHALILLGGGHDFAAPHFTGFLEGWIARGGPVPRPGLINIDPHLDVRELKDGRPTSGTPFREILEGPYLAGKNFVQFGYRRNRNARAHLRYCQEREVNLISYEAIRAHKSAVSSAFERALSRLQRRCTVVGITLDMDCCPDTEGTSAAPVVGFSAEELCTFTAIAGGAAKVAYFEIAEVAPTLETGDRSARIAAEVIYNFLDARARSFKKRHTARS